MAEGGARHDAGRLSGSILVLFFAGALAFLYLRTFLLPATPFVAIDDQILFFARAVRVLHGQVPYRDFLEIVTPGTELIYAAEFRLFGIHAWVMPAWGIAIGFALSFVVTLIASRILRGPVMLLPALLFLIFDFNSALDMTHHWYSTLFVLAAVAALSGGSGIPRIIAAGSLCGVATLFTQTSGTLTVVALVIYLVWLRRSEAGKFSTPVSIAVLVLPFVLIVSCVLGYFIYKAGFRTLVFDLFIFPIRFMSSADVNQPGTYFRQLHELATSSGVLRLIPVMFIYILVPYVYFFGLHQLRRQCEVLPASRRKALVLLHLVGLALFLAVASGPRYFRLCTVAAPAILICIWLLSQPGRAHRLARRLLCILAIVFAVLFSFHRQTQWHGTLNLPVGRTAFTDFAMYREFQWLAQRTQPSEFFFNDSDLGLYLSLDNPTGSEFLTYADFTRPEEVAAVIQSLRQRPPHFIILLTESEKPSELYDHAASFRQYVHENYHLAQIFYIEHSRYGHEFWEHGVTAGHS
jgi:hypothetical protein